MAPLDRSLSLLLEELIKDAFLTYRVGKLEVSLDWLSNAFARKLKSKCSSLFVREYLRETNRLQNSAAPKRLRIPVAANYEQLDAQGHPTITEYHTEIARPYLLLVQDWLTAEELQVFANPVPGAEHLLPEAQPEPATA